MGGATGEPFPDLKHHLLTRVLPFWERHSVDADCGGFITHLDCSGRIADPSEKFLVMQTRMIYSFAAAAEMGGSREWLNLAEQGVIFLLEHFRDRDHDGWYWSTTRRGAPRELAKRTYGHAFATYALAEYARIARNRRALAAAIHTWSLIATHLWDAEHQGVIEACDRTWSPTDPSHSMGTHLHTLEALLALHEATGEDRFWPHVRAICDLICGRMVEPQHRCGLEKFHPDWSHNSDLSRNLVDYGHNCEAAWLLLRVHRREENPTYRDAAHSFLDYVLRYGLDTAHGGVFSHGPLGEPATVREKVWWVQTEAVVAFLVAHIVFQDSRYLDAFRSVVDFSLRHLHDAEYGEWYPATHEDGRPCDTRKGFEWKAAYHVTQACVYGHSYLTDISQQR